MKVVFEIGILNTHNGKTVKSKIMSDDSAYLNERIAFRQEVKKAAQKISTWVDKQDTFFSGKKIWDVWIGLGELSSLDSLLEGKAWKDSLYRTVMVFDGEDGRGTEYQFYIERKEERGWL